MLIIATIVMTSSLYIFNLLLYIFVLTSCILISTSYFYLRFNVLQLCKQYSTSVRHTIFIFCRSNIENATKPDSYVRVGHETNRNAFQRILLIVCRIQHRFPLLKFHVWCHLRFHQLKQAVSIWFLHGLQLLFLFVCISKFSMKCWMAPHLIFVQTSIC